MKWLLDTNIVVDPFAGNLAELLPEGELYCSIITELECLSAPGIDPESETMIRSFLTTVTVIGLEASVCEATISFRRTRSLKLPDAIIAATAQTLGATLLTNDDRMLRVTSIATRSIPRRTA